MGVAKYLTLIMIVPAIEAYQQKGRKGRGDCPIATSLPRSSRISTFDAEFILLIYVTVAARNVRLGRENRTEIAAE